ncbi:MAG: Ig-like domain-containing protein [Flavobacteriaceae bacterium]|nr:Ig-like domain-containing protein [Flavobacteriaceae bacterium]
MSYLRFFLFSLVLLSISCARRGRPEGGPEDFDKPIMVKADPDFESLHFADDEIKIYFDEFIKLKDINSQLIVSPPLKYPIVITPLGTPSKRITIKITDTLQENTTYTFNFGQSIIDNTRGNILENFKFVISTGDYIDSLKVVGTYKDAFQLEMKEKPTVMLYEVNENFNDSIIYNEKPIYVGAVLDSVNWNITNIKAGKYLLVALSDVSKNYKFNPKEDQISFLSKFITVPKDTVYSLKFFKEILPFGIPSKAKEESKGHIMFGFEGDPVDFKVKTISETSTDFKALSIFDREKDTLHYWFNNFKKDSISFYLYKNKVFDTVKVRLKSKNIDSLALTSTVSVTLNLRDTFKIKSNTPMIYIDTTKIYFINKDSIKVPYQYIISKYKDEVVFNFKKEFSNKYFMELLPGAITDFYGVINDTLKVNFSTKKPSNYSSLFTTIKGVKSYPIIVDLIDSKGSVVATDYLINEREIQFRNLSPSKYMVRVIYDVNKNKKWDTGSFLQRLQPEEVYYFKKIISAKANWDITEPFTVN